MTVGGGLVALQRAFRLSFDSAFVASVGGVAVGASFALVWLLASVAGG